MTAETTDGARMPFWKNTYDAWARWRMERRLDRAERQAGKKLDPPNVTVPQWLVESARAAAWLAMATLVYFLWVFTLDIAGDQAVPLHLTHVGGWVGEIAFYFPLIVGFVFIAIGVPFMAKIIIPIFVSLDWRTNTWPKAWSLFLVVAFSAVVFAGTFSVQGKTILEHGRVSAVAVAEVNQGRAAIQAQIDQETSDLRDMMNNRNSYMAQAANVGAAHWQSYIDQAAHSANADDRARVGLLSRAMGAAQSADDKRTHITALRTQLAAAPVAESVQANVATTGTSWIASTLDWLVGARAILLSLVMDVVCLLMPWIALRLEQTRNRQMGMVEGIAKHPWMLEDHAGEPMTDQSAHDAAYTVFERGGTKEEAIAAAKEAAKPAPVRRTFTDADTGEEIEQTLVKPKQEHWRTLRKGKKTPMEFKPPIPPDETGATTGTGDERGALTNAASEQGFLDQFEKADDGAKEDHAEDQSAPAIHPEPPAAEAAVEEPLVIELPDLTDDEAAVELDGSADPDENQSDEDDHAAPDSGADEPLEQHEVTHDQDPITNPARLLPVAAE